MVITKKRKKKKRLRKSDGTSTDHESDAIVKVNKQNLRMSKSEIYLKDWRQRHRRCDWLIMVIHIDRQTVIKDAGTFVGVAQNKGELHGGAKEIRVL